ncbi:MAG: membrane protein insertion efficiency factor YidD [Candidatus Marinimicrobia bacterium]|jgi:putative component of membrane protein insertase Oxa1/YidC/SpoIIIJ protein YidD/TM2 domain-containing membrane protein YozV|nr:membrane protein insertion efficiency factor YidD [Candidatus Neomarinimicrobiota bacterium]
MFLKAQTNVFYPADSLLSSRSVSLIRKSLIFPIAGWQRLSYKSNGLDCQFSPSCSNYGAHAIAKHGIMLGPVMAADRIARCNPMALEYHAKLGNEFLAEDFRILDPVKPMERNSEKSPFVAAMMSAMIPGAGRIYAERSWDGIFGFMMFAMPASSAYRMRDNTDSAAFSIYAIVTAIFYGGEIYGAWRTAKYYQKVE